MAHKGGEIITHESMSEREQGYEQGQMDMWETVEKRLPEIVGNAMDERLKMLMIQENNYIRVKWWVFSEAVVICGILILHIAEFFNGWRR
jgi:hypothetical protein